MLRTWPASGVRHGGYPEYYVSIGPKPPFLIILMHLPGSFGERVRPDSHSVGRVRKRDTMDTNPAPVTGWKVAVSGAGKLPFNVT